MYTPHTHTHLTAINGFSPHCAIRDTSYVNTSHIVRLGWDGGWMGCSFRGCLGTWGRDTSSGLNQYNKESRLEKAASARWRAGKEERETLPHEKLLGDGFSTPMPLFWLICTIISNKTSILDLYQKTNFEWAGVDTSGRVRHPPYSKKLFVWVETIVGRVHENETASIVLFSKRGLWDSGPGAWGCVPRTLALYHPQKIGVMASTKHYYISDYSRGSAGASSILAGMRSCKIQ